MSSAADLAREIADLKRRLAAVERSSQLGRSSIDAGTLTVNDESGQPVLAVGKQDDGSFKVVGANGGSVVANDVDLLPGTITETEIADGAISTPKLAANAVTAANIAAGSITADRLSVGTLPENVVADPSFEDSPTRVQRLTTVTGSGTWSFTGSSAFDGSFAARVANTAADTTRMYLTDPFPVTPGDTYVVKGAVRGATGTTGGASILLRVVDSLGATTFIQTSSPGATGAWAQVQTSGVIPAGAVTGQVILQSTSQTVGTWDYDLVDVRRQLTGVAIQNGTIVGSTLLIDTPSTASVKVDGETGEIILTGTDGRVVSLVPSNINPEMRFYSKAKNVKAFINQPSTNDLHATLGMNSGGYIPPDGEGRTLRLFLNSAIDRGQLETVRNTDQLRMGGYVWFNSGQLHVGNYNDVTGVDTYMLFDDDGKVYLAAKGNLVQTVDAFASGFVSTASTSYVALSGNPGVVFVCPPSDKVMVHLSSALDGSASNSMSRMSFEIREGGTIGSGTIVRAVSDEYSIALEGAAANECGRSTLIWGLTPGTTYNLRCLYKNDTGGGTGGFARRKVVVEPLLV